jgi:hypothetical protein
MVSEDAVRRISKDALPPSTGRIMDFTPKRDPGTEELYRRLVESM